MFMKFIFLNVLLLLISGCASKQDSVSSVDKHVIKSSELRLLMRNLSSSVDDRHESELERDTIRRRYALRLSNNAKEFSSLIRNIPKERLGNNIDDTDMEVFYGYAKELEKKAGVLHEIAEAYEIEKLDSAVNNLKRTCNACHKTFRGF